MKLHDEQHQQKLSDLSARYMLMYALSVTSSIVFMQIANTLGIMGGNDELAFAVAVPDFCINIGLYVTRLFSIKNSKSR